MTDDPASWRISCAGYEASVARRGATLVSLAREDDDLIEPGDVSGVRSGAHGQILAPWPNRLRDGRWRWRGVDHELPVDEPARGVSASHGLVRWAYWTVEDAADEEISLRFDLAPRPGYPFPLAFRCRYSLSARGLDVALSARNVGTADAPVALGAHPYLRPRGALDEAEIDIPAQTELPFDHDGRPLGLRAVSGMTDLRGRTRLRHRALNHTLGGLRGDDGRVRCRLWSGDRVVTLWAGDTCRWLQVYTGEGLGEGRQRSAIAVEPMTAPPQALATGDATILGPGETLTLRWGISAAPA